MITRLILSVFAYALCALATLSHQDYPITSVTSYVITGATHGQGTCHLAMNVLDSNGQRVSSSGYGVSCNGANYNVTFTKAAAFTGTLQLLINLPGSTTTGSSDFKAATTDYSSPTDPFIDVCQGCSTTSPAYRSDGTQNYGMASTITGSVQVGTATTVRVWLADKGQIIFATSNTAIATCPKAAGVGCDQAQGVTSFPSGVVQLAQVDLSAAGVFSSYSDLRPTGFR